MTEGGAHTSTRVLVTGGAGYIGSHLVDELVRSGAEVVVLDDLSTGSEANLREARQSSGMTFHRGSVLDDRLVHQLVAESQLVFHLAAAVGITHVLRDPLGAMQTNLRGTDNVLSAAQREGVRVVLASTSEVYGRSTEVPFREDGLRVLGPTWVHRWSYSSAKAIDEHLAFAYADRGLKMSIVRYFNSYGPRLDPRGYGSVVARFASQALRGEEITVYGDGEQTRCFTYVSDTVEGTLRAGSASEAVGQVFNVGSDREVSVNELAARIRDAVGSSSPIKHVPYTVAYGPAYEDTRRRIPDISWARARIGFTARVRLEDGLARTLEWCRQSWASATA